MQSTYLLGVLFAIVIPTVAFFRSRNSGMKEHYAAWWIVVALASVVGSSFPQPLHALAYALGIQVSLNLALFTASIVILLLTLRLSVDLSQASEERRTLVEEIAVLNSDTGVLRGKIAVPEASKGSDSRD